MDIDKIKKQAGQILEGFSDALASVEKEAKEGACVEREEFERKEGSGEESALGFREAFLKNSPAHDDDFIIAETGDWK